MLALAIFLNYLTQLAAMMMVIVIVYRTLNHSQHKIG